MKMLCTSFAPLGKPRTPTEDGLFPAAQQEALESMHAQLNTNLLNGVYRAGIALLMGNHDGAAAARADVFNQLTELNLLLGTSRFLFGEQLTVVDIRLCMCLLRFDAAYYRGFGLDQHQGGRGAILIGDSFPNVRRFVRELYQHVSPTVHWPTFRQYYRWCPGHPSDQLHAIVASAQNDGL